MAGVRVTSPSQLNGFHDSTKLDIVNEYEWEQGPFELLYEQWAESGSTGERDQAITTRMTATYREAWGSGLRHERTSVLYYLALGREQDGADLVIEGLNSDDGYVAGVAATVASVTYGLKRMQFGPELRPAFRALVRRFPLNDVVRPRDLYGHQPGDEDDTLQRPFVNLYEDWRAETYPGDTALARRLADTYRETWIGGDNIDRAFVLLYLPGPPTVGAPRTEGIDLIMESLETRDPALAPVAAFVTGTHLRDGIQLGPDTRVALESLRDRFPDQRYGHVSSALYELDKLEGIERDPDDAS
jgi:hypothetical protein